ncbi:ABC transporter permease [Xylanimonas ulmi]|uniref:Transport permease protein n=1 Tax=Xylanimonas ulmi TaxID=228973 RepID=A0A4Q7M7R4_9MICO|nr:ABC transporter permease [Xylanibacterium ulmi]RZS62718.1 ABC-2 type transport system permease protein [Xylanibacterium ulmi]
MTTLTTTPHLTPARQGPLTAVRHALADAATMAGRSLRLARRDIDVLVTATAVPVMILLMFTFVFGGAVDVGIDYIQYATPGIILLCAGFGAASTAVAVEQDMSGGMVDRLRSLPTTPWTFLFGHVVAAMARNLVTTGVVFAVAAALGFRPSAGVLGWLAAVGLLTLFINAIAWAAAFNGAVVRSPEAAGAFSFVVMFFPYVSSAFVPVETLPTWMRGFAQHQPVTPLIETVRGLLVPGTPGAVSGDELGSTALLAVVWCLGLTVVFAALAAWAYRRRR